MRMMKPPKVPSTESPETMGSSSKRGRTVGGGEDGDDDGDDEVRR